MFPLHLLRHQHSTAFEYSKTICKRPENCVNRKKRINVSLDASLLRVRTVPLANCFPLIRLPMCAYLM